MSPDEYPVDLFAIATSGISPLPDTGNERLMFMKGKRLLKISRDIVIILLSTAVLLSVIETGTRIYLRLKTHSWPVTEALRFDRGMRELLSLYRRHPYLNTAPREGQNISVFGKKASLNSHGYRSRETDPGKDPAGMRILCSGGSTTFDTLAEDNEHTWPLEMEQALRNSGLPAEVLNAGFPGWSSLENLISLEIRDLDMEPDIIILFQGINDLQPAAHQPFDPQYEHGHAERCLSVLGFNRKSLPWYEHSLFFEKTRALFLGKRDFWAWSKSETPHGSCLSEIPGKALRTFRRNLRSFISIARAHDARVILTTQTIRLRQSDMQKDRAHLEEWIPGLEAENIPVQLERMNEIMRHLCSSDGIMLADVARNLYLEDADFGDPMHFSATGSRKMADFMARIIRKVSARKESDDPGEALSSAK